MKTALLTTTALILAATWGWAQDDQNAELISAFADRYEDPVVTCSPTEISDLSLCSVFERANLVEDPLIPDCWLLSSMSQEHECNAAGVQDALREIAFVPGSDEDALTVARVVCRALDEDLLPESGVVPQPTVPEEAVATVLAPSVTRSGDIFTVDFYTYYMVEVALWFEESAPEGIRHHTIQVGPEHFSMSSERVWSGRYSPYP